jgi:hypothetical protein
LEGEGRRFSDKQNEQFRFAPQSQGDPIFLKTNIRRVRLRRRRATPSKNRKTTFGRFCNEVSRLAIANKERGDGPLI